MNTDVPDALGIEKGDGSSNASGLLVPLSDVDNKEAKTYTRPNETCQKVKSIFIFENDCHKKNFIQTLCVYFNCILLVSVIPVSCHTNYHIYSFIRANESD